MLSDSRSARRARSPSPHSYSPSRRAIRLAHRLPLSTVDTYRGSRGRAVSVEYQLYRWPRHFSSPSRVSSILEIKNSPFSRASRSRSTAPRMDSRAIPMLVGEVRRARPTAGRSCQLSGGSQLSWGRRNVSKYPQMSPAWWSRKARSAGDTPLLCPLAWLSAQAMAGAHIQTKPTAMPMRSWAPSRVSSPTATENHSRRK